MALQDASSWFCPFVFICCLSSQVALPLTCMLSIAVDVQVSVRRKQRCEGRERCAYGVGTTKKGGSSACKNTEQKQDGAELAIAIWQKWSAAGALSAALLQVQWRQTADPPLRADQTCGRAR